MPAQLALSQSVQQSPITSLDSYFGREHPALYAERLVMPWKDISFIFGHIIEAPMKAIADNSYSRYSHPVYKNRAWLDYFPDGQVDVRPRQEVGLPALPLRCLSSNSHPGSPINSRAIRVGSMIFLSGQKDFLIEEVRGFGPIKVQLFERLAELLSQDAATQTSINQVEN